MRIALLSDVHANLHALQAIAAHARAAGCEEFWNLGDSIGYGPSPEETVDFIRRMPAVSILGNYDRKVLAIPKKRERWRESKHPLKFQAFAWAYENLSKRNRKYLGKLPGDRRLEIDSVRFHLVHGSPASDEEVIMPGLPPDRLRLLAGMSGSHVTLCGHSHTPFSLEFEGHWFLNPGSVGRPGDGDPRASYGIVSVEGERWSFELFRMAYDVDAAVAAMSEKGLPVAFGRMLREGRSLDDLDDRS